MDTCSHCGDAPHPGSCYENPDLTVPQYHAMMDKLWSVVPDPPTPGENVADLVCKRIAELEAQQLGRLDPVKVTEEFGKLKAQVERLRETLKLAHDELCAMAYRHHVSLPDVTRLTAATLAEGGE